jgi:Skp family chaperone for outer membrane proteins
MALLSGGPALAQNAANVPTFTAPVAGAATAPAGQIPIILGVLDTQALVFQSTAGKGIINQANAIADSYDADFQKKQDALRSAAVQLEAKRNATPPISQQELEAGRKALGQQDAALHAADDKNKQTLDDRVSRARQSILTVAEKIVQDIAKARGLTLVLNQSAVALSPPQWNITNEAMQRLNKALPAVKL